MTTLVGLQHDDWCIIASDSKTSFSNFGTDGSPIPKIAINKQYIIAGAGMVRGSNLAHLAFNPPRAPKENLDKFMVTKFIPALRKCFVQHGYDMKESSDIAQHDSEFIVAINGIIYQIDPSYSIERLGSKYYVNGSGFQFAMGALDALDANQIDNHEDAIEAVEKAVKTAIKYDIYSGGKVQIAIQQKSGKSFIATLDDEDEAEDE
jgi:20S proteasome alpha/beta subunit